MWKKPAMAPATPTAPNCWTTAAARPTPWAGCCCTCTACRARRRWTKADAICTALQLINFWQDLSVDLPRARFYLPDEDCAAHGVDRAQLLELQPTAQTTALINELSRWTRATMLRGAPLVHRVPGRMGWELRLVVQGGLRILDKVDALQGRSLCQRPRIRAWDAPGMLARALAM
jgi:phytoene/squalene synthetase